MSSVRHHMFRSGALDLGFFDQVIFLISQGERPVSSILGFHILADHAAYTVYFLAPLYQVFGDVHMLLAVQAIALSLGAYPLWRLALGAGATRGQAVAIAIAYLLYPIILATNVFDFHPETLSVPAFLFAVLAARERRPVMFALSLVLALGGKEILALTACALGVWLIVFEHRRAYGIAAIMLGSAWFAFATSWLIPHFGAGKAASGLAYFGYLGGSVPQIAINAFVHPTRWMAAVFSLRAFTYVCVLLLPVCWGLSPKHLAPLLMIGGPTMLLNILSDPAYQNMTAPFSHYSLMIVPFLFVSIVGAVAARDSFVQRPRLIAGWSIALVLLGAMARLTVVRGQHAGDLDSHAASRDAIQEIDDSGGVLTTHEIVPHVSQRRLIQYVSDKRTIAPIEHFDYVLLNLAHGSMHTTDGVADSIREQVQNDANFNLTFHRDSVYLYRRTVRISSDPAIAIAERDAAPR